MASKKRQFEFPSFYSWLLQTEAYDEDVLNDLVDSAYNDDTYTVYLMQSIIDGYVRLPNKPSLPRVFREVHETANWTIQSSEETDDIKELRRAAAKYAAKHAKFIVRNWKTLTNIYS